MRFPFPRRRSGLMEAISTLVRAQIPPISRKLGTTSRSRIWLPALQSQKIQIRRLRKIPRGLGIVFAEGDGLGLGEDGGGEDPKIEGRPQVFKLRWRDLLNPDPENILAVALTGLLTWASVQVLWQLFFISAAILLAALKYSFIAALLLFILITLL